jgi:hypothetical protein
MASEFSITEIENREHIAPDKTGDNIAAKRTAGYGWNGSNWARTPLPLITSPYDSIGFADYDSNGNPGTITYSNLGDTVATLTLTYSGSDLTSVVRT